MPFISDEFSCDFLDCLYEMLTSDTFIINALLWLIKTG